MRQPIINLLDIETAPTLAYIWDLVTRYVPHSNIAEAGFTLCWAAKRLGKKKVTYRSVHHHGEEKMVRDAWDLLNESDMVIHYNGKKFDIPKLNQEFLRFGLGPPSPFQQIDLYLTAKSRFKLLSNSMAYVAKLLGLESKLHHKGMALWTECMAGNKASWKTMKDYNIQDVHVLEQVYGKLLPWIQPHPNMGLYVDTEKPICPHCGSNHIQSRGSYYTNTMRYPRFQCREDGSREGYAKCMKWSRGRFNDLTKYDRQNMLVGVK